MIFVKSRGQVSFEALFITLIVLSSAMYMTNLYLQTHDVTIATVIARNDLLQQLNSMEDAATLREVRIVSVDNAGVLEAEISVSTNPPTLQESDFITEKIEDTKAKIINSTKFNKVTFKINS